MNNYICALDIGSNKIAAVLAEFKKQNIVNMFFDAVPSKGVKKGVIVNSIDTVTAIGRVMKSLKSKSGVSVKSVYANISGQDIVTKRSKAIIPLADRGNKVIMMSDIHRVNEQARILGSNLEEEIIHQIPSAYTIDSKSNISNPLGLYSHRLEVDLYLISAKTSSLQTLSRVINQSGYDMKEVFFTGLATSQAVFSQEIKTGIHILCDIGSDITEILLFKEGTLADMTILSLGGDDITLRLADELKLSADLAEEVKRSHGSVGDHTDIPEKKEVLIKKSTLYKPIQQRLICQTVTAQAHSMAQTIKGSIERVVPLQELQTLTVTGRAVMLEGFLEMMENQLGIGVKIGRITNPVLTSVMGNHDALSGQKYLTYTAALGILCQVVKKEEMRVTAQRGSSFIKRGINKVKEIYQEYF